MYDVAITAQARWFNSSSSTILCNTVTGRYCWLNQTGTAIWLALVGHATLFQLENLLKDSYGLSDEVATRYLHRTIDLLRDRGLVEFARGGGVVQNAG
jgi:hypothetical protein